MKMAYKCSHVELSTYFIDNCLTGCLPVYPLIYIYSLRRATDGQAVTTEEIGEKFALTEREVIKAWRHWEKQQLISLSGDEKTSLAITFLPVPTASNPPAAPVSTDKTAQLLDFSPPKRAAYTPDEIAFFRDNNKAAKGLFEHAEATLGGTLQSPVNLEFVFSLHDSYRLPIDVVKYLLTYCAEKDNKDLRYIEKVAQDWVEKGIADVAAAKDYSQNFDNNNRTIKRHMGLTGSLTPYQKKFIDRWLHEFKMPIDVIVIAIEKCTHAINSPKFSYVDRMLEGWHNDGINTVDAANAAAAPPAKAPRKKQSRFASFELQREIDFTKLEKLEREYQAKKYNTGS
jgi:DnaD/phage-associated family protein